MTQTLNWAVAGGGATVNKNAQLIRLNALRRCGLHSPDWTILSPRLIPAFGLTRPTDNVSEFTARGGHIHLLSSSHNAITPGLSASRKLTASHRASGWLVSLEWVLLRSNLVLLLI